MTAHSVLPRLALSAALAATLPVSPGVFAQETASEEATPAAPESSPLAREPRNAEEYFDAVLLMVRLDRPQLALRYLDELLALDPDADTLLALREKHGTGTFLQLARMESLRPQSQDLLQKLTEASLARINDPAYLNGVLDRLSGSPREQAEAVDELKHLGAAAVPPLLQRLNDPESNIDRSVVISTLIQLGEPAVAPLLGAIRAPSERLRGDVIEALGYIGARDQVLPHLWYPAFASDSPDGVRAAARTAIARMLYGDAQRVSRIPSFGIAQKLRDSALQNLRGDMDQEPGEDGLIGIWTWDDAAGTVVEHRVTPVSASLYVGQELARDALNLEPADADGQALFLALALAADVERAGWDRPAPTGPGTAHDLALIAGADTVERVLALALSANNPAAALQALRALGEVGTRHLLQRSGETWPPLVLALDAPDSRVQFAAATAVMQLDPQVDFGRSQRVVEIFARELAGSDQNQSVIIDPNRDRATIVASLVHALGFETAIATTGQEGFQLATDRPVGLAVVHLNSVRWELSQTIASFRADARTRNVPIAIYGPPGMEPAVKELLEAQPVVYIEEVNDTRDLSRALRPMLAQVTPPPLSEEQRTSQRAAAAYWLRHIAERHLTGIFDLRTAEEALSSGVNDPALARDALIALGGVPTPSAQQRLAETAVAPALDVPTRETAALQLAFHIQRFGTLIENGTLSDLQTAYTQAADPAIQTALAAVIGSLKPAEESVSRTLREYPLPTAPAD